MDPRLQALNRFGLGARPGERSRVKDPQGWLLDQIEGPRVAESAGVTGREMADALRAVRMAGQADRRERQQARQRLIRLAASEQQAALRQRITTDQPFLERLTAFWSNHLCVSTAAKLTVIPFAGSYERDVIRKHIFGRFEDMVLASARHPAMLFYLDNFQSIGPASRGAAAGRRRIQQRGLNENYARELLELHTLGVNGGYTQHDVLELARMLTGWTVAGLNGPAARTLPRTNTGAVEFAFAEMLHEPGEKTLLGTRYAEAGVKEGERAIRALCHHPSTAHFVATKLVRHFVSDDPPTAAVEHVRNTFARTGGDLKAVTRALVESPAAWTESARKFRTPQDWLIAVSRALSAQNASFAMPPLLRQLRHPLWSPQAPKGFSDTLDDWADPDALLNRAELARTLSNRINTEVEPRELLDVVDIASNHPLHTLVADTRIAAKERIALAIASPAFQWR